MSNAFNFVDILYSKLYTILLILCLYTIIKNIYMKH